jgi:arylsulfatase A-like enzyme
MIKIFVFIGIFFFSVIISKSEVSAEKPNIVWLLSEDNSKYYLKLFDEHGIETPEIKKLADRGLIFTHAFSNSPVCSVARSTLITGCYAPRIGTNFHRASRLVPMPEGVEMFPAYLREAGYYTTNNQKEDYNAIKSDDVWDESSGKAHWRNRKAGQPFFHQQNVGNTHESQLHFDHDFFKNHKLITNPDAVFVAPVHPDTKLFRFTNAYYRERMLTADAGVAEVVKQLEEDGLLENTFIFYFGDHGGVLPGSKGYLYETGLHVPLVVRVPENFRHMINYEPGSSIHNFVSFVDFGPTALHLAGLEVPPGMDGKPFLGEGISDADITSDQTYGYADRFDEKYDLVRSLRKGKYKYLRNYQPFNPDGLYNDYRYKMLAFQEWKNLYREGKLNEVQSQFFEPRQPEQLFDVEKDPYETKNLAKDPEYAQVLNELRQLLTQKVKATNDLSFYPESELRKEAFDHPVAFGKAHKQEISEMIDIADLSVRKFEDAKKEIESALNSPNPWKRYWGLIVCSSFGKQALEFSNKVQQLSMQDQNLLVRTRAAEFLYLNEQEQSNEVLKDVLSKTNDDIEATLILNTVVLLMDGPHQHNFNLTKALFNPEVLKGEYVKLRLDYILPLQKEMRVNNK